MGRKLKTDRPVSREALRRRRLRAEGRCVDCGAPAHNGGSRCLPHGLRLRAASTSYRRDGTRNPDAPVANWGGRYTYDA
jgi:hypothetical protein